MSFAESKLIPAMRKQLIREARWINEGRWDDKPESWLAARLRRTAPALASLSDVPALAAFSVLCEEVASIDALSDPAVRCPHTCPAELAFAIAVLTIHRDMTLLTLVPSEAA